MRLVEEQFWVPSCIILGLCWPEFEASLQNCLIEASSPICGSRINAIADLKELMDP